MRSSFFVFLLSFFALCISSANAKLFNAEEFFLQNGMRVIVVENHKAPIVKHMVWYKAGAMDDPYGKAGIAHLLEHVMFRGTKKVKDGEFNRIVAENGGQSNAFTAQDYTAYHQLVDVSRLELMMALEADRMQNLRISKKVFDTERDVVFQERKQVVENNPASDFFETFRHNLWQRHPYGRPIIGTAEEIMSLTLEDAKAFYSKYYAPNNAILVLSGDIDVDTAKILAEKYYGELQMKNLDERSNELILNNKFTASLEMALPHINAPRVVMTYIAPSYAYQPSDVYSLMILSKYLGDGETSALYKKLVLEKKIALSVSSDYHFAARSYGNFTISVLPKEFSNSDAFLKTLDAEIKQAVREINSEKMEVTKKKILAGLVYLRDNPEDAAMIVGSMAAVGMSLDEIENYAENIEKVSVESVLKAAENLFSNSISQKGVLK